MEGSGAEEEIPSRDIAGSILNCRSCLFDLRFLSINVSPPPSPPPSFSSPFSSSLFFSPRTLPLFSEPRLHLLFLFLPIMATSWPLLPPNNVTCANSNNSLIRACYNKGTCLDSGSVNIPYARCVCESKLDPLSFCERNFFEELGGKGWINFFVRIHT